MQVAAAATLADVLRHLESYDDPALPQHTAPVWACRERYGV